MHTQTSVWLSEACWWNYWRKLIPVQHNTVNVIQRKTFTLSSLADAINGEKGSQLGENRKGCVMSFPYQCLATALLTSCPAGPAGICRLTLLPSPTQTATHFVPLWNTLTSRYWLISQFFIPLSLMNALMHKGKCFLSATYWVYTSCLFFPTYFPQERLGPFIIMSSLRSSTARSWSVCFG